MKPSEKILEIYNSKWKTSNEIDTTECWLNSIMDYLDEHWERNNINKTALNNIENTYPLNRGI